MIPLSVSTHMALIAGLVAIFFVLTATWRWPSEKSKWLKIFLFSIGLFGLWIAYVKPQYLIHLPKMKAVISQDTSGMVSEDAVLFSDIYSLLNDKVYPQVDTVILTNTDISPQDLDLIDDKYIRYRPAKWDSGIINFFIPKIYAEKEWKITGSVKDISAIWMTSPDGESIQGKIVNHQFVISSTAPVQGDYLYDLAMITSAGDTLKEQLPVHVLPTNIWKMLVLSSSPNFEINYFKNYWANQGHGLAMQIQLSQDNYQSTFINIDRYPIQPITPKKLDRFHFLNTDISTWNALGSYSRNLILQAVQEKGLSLILIPNSSEQHIDLPAPVQISKGQDLKFNSSLEEVSLPAYSIQNSKRWQSVFFQNRIIGKYYRLGVGNIAIPALTQSYRLLLADEEVIYHNLWATFYSSIYVYPDRSFRFHLPQMAFEKQKAEILMISGSEHIFPLQWNDSITLPVIASPLVESVYTAHFWPEQGWNKLTSRDGDILQYLYVHPTSSWQAYQQEMLSNAIALQTDPEEALLANSGYAPWPWYIGLVITLLGFGGLWLVERLGK